MDSICYIQARAGSKRIPDKNIQKVGEYTLVEHAILKAKESRIFSAIVVTSDSQYILDLALAHEVYIHKRSPATASDTATDSDVAAEVLKWYPGYKIACCLYPGIPLLPASRLWEAYDMMRGFNTVIPVKEYPHPPERAILPNGEYWMLENAAKRTQEFGPMLYDAGAFTFFRADKFEGNINIEPMWFVKLDKYEHFDIDDKADLEFVRRLYGNNITQ